MKLRIISDIHADINKGYEFDFGNDFVVCCGDISGNRLKTEDWVRENIKQGIFIEGNHLGYDRVSFDENDSLTSSIEYLRTKFSSGDVVFLENNYKIIDDVVFIGCILYTDFSLYNDEEHCKHLAKISLNDFRYVKVLKDGVAKTITPDDTVEFHKASLEFIEETCQKFQDKKIVVISHHAPSEKCIEEKYKDDLLSAAFASDLEWLIKKYDNIKLWCHGHVHHDVNFTLHDTRVIAHPFGYYNENNRDLKNYGLMVEI